MANIKNISSASVTVIARDISLHRSIAPGRTIKITDEAYDELCFDNGFQVLVKNGFLKVDGVKDFQETIEVVEDKIVSRDEIEDILKREDITAFATLIDGASPATKETIAQLAIDMNVTKPAFTVLIQKHCGVDVLKAITARDE